MKTNQMFKMTSALFLAVLFTACAGVQAGNNKQTANIVAANQAFMATFSRADAAGMAALYTKDGTLMPTHSDFVKGQESISAVWQSVFDAGIKEAKLETLEVDGVGDSLYEVGKYTLFVEDGKVADSGKYIVIWKMVDGQWKMHHDIFNTSLPAAK